MQIEDKGKAKAKLQAMCNSYAERNSSICFCKLLGQCPSIELRYEWVQERDWKGGNGFHSCLYLCLKLPEIQAFA